MDDDTREHWRLYLIAMGSIGPTADHEPGDVPMALSAADRLEERLIQHLGGLDAARAHVRDPETMTQLTELAASVHVSPDVLDWALTPMKQPAE